MPAGRGAEIRNFRDVGGKRTHDGRAVRMGLIYRSAALDGLDEAQYAHIRRLGIRLIVDFRSGVERSPTGRPFSDPGIKVWRRADVTTDGAPQHAVAPFLACAPGDKRPMQNVYRIMPTVQASAFAMLFRAIAANDLPLLFHCAAGKDRTGVATALLLDLLGVPRDLIQDDYQLSERWIDQTREEFLVNFADRDEMLTQEARWRSMLLTDPDYLDAMFDEIDRTHGGTRSYMIDRLELEPAAIDRIIDLLVA